ncbi:MAG TPA: ornithine cyclodeaminase family protein, partial [Rhodospirillales bacterium]|nr:ornithine cyclodeaminase family protein [Rhodospirillales bacterium]
TLRRTAAASALAARFLAREDASSLLVIGAGALAPHLVRAHAAVRPLRRVMVWNRTPARAHELAAGLAEEGFEARAVEDRLAAIEEADIVSCATMSRTPLVPGERVHPGTHVDLVGAFRPDMRESDDALLRRAAVYVDTMAGALAEAGDILLALASGALSREDIRGDLYALCQGRVEGRRDAREITVFKSVGSAVEDLAAAAMVAARLG